MVLLSWLTDPSLFSRCFVLQDNPEQEVLYLVRGLLNVLNDYPWDANSDTKALIFINMVVMLSAMSQEQFIYHMDKGAFVLSRDTRSIVIVTAEL